MPDYQCHHCNVTLSYTQYARSHYCEKGACQCAKVRNYLVAKKQRLSEQLNTQIQDFTQSAATNDIASRLVIDIENITPVVALLPANTNMLQDSNPERKQMFMHHLSSIYEDVKENNSQGNEVYCETLLPPTPEKEAELMGKACATCMGSCCNLGKTHAFLDYPSLKHILGLQSAALTENELLTLYSEYFPEQSYEYSCVFLGKNGCTLPRDLRSFTCNNFLCDEITNYRIALSQADSAVTFAAAIHNDTIVHSSVFDEDSFIRVVEK